MIDDCEVHCSLPSIKYNFEFVWNWCKHAKKKFWPINSFSVNNSEERADLIFGRWFLDDISWNEDNCTPRFHWQREKTFSFPKQRGRHSRASCVIEFSCVIYVIKVECGYHNWVVFYFWWQSVWFEKCRLQLSRLSLPLLDLYLKFVWIV